MAVPKSITKINKNGIKFVSSVDAVNYTLNELTRAALRDCAKLIRKRLITKFRKLKGMGKNRRLYRSIQYWVRRRETDLVIGFKHDTWYGAKSEQGRNGQPARHLLRTTVIECIPEMRQIQAQYLKKIQNEKVRGLNESDYTSPPGAE